MDVKNQFFDLMMNMVVNFVMAFKSQFPDVYNLLEEHYLKVAWGGTKAFTVAQRFCQQQGIDKLFTVEKQSKQIHFIRNGRKVEKNDGYEMVLYDVLQEDGKKYNTKRFDTFDQVIDFEMTDKPFVTADSVNMLGLQIHQKDTGRKFELTLDNNYFVEGNVLFDIPMVKFFLKEYHNTSILDSEEYEITFIDQDMDVKVLTQNQYVVIENGGYTIRNVSDTN